MLRYEENYAISWRNQMTRLVIVEGHNQSLSNCPLRLGSRMTSLRANYLPSHQQRKIKKHFHIEQGSLFSVPAHCTVCTASPIHRHSCVKMYGTQSLHQSCFGLNFGCTLGNLIMIKYIAGKWGSTQVAHASCFCSYWIPWCEMTFWICDIPLYFHITKVSIAHMCAIRHLYPILDN